VSQKGSFIPWISHFSWFLKIEKKTSYNYLKVIFVSNALRYVLWLWSHIDFWGGSVLVCNVKKEAEFPFDFKYSALKAGEMDVWLHAFLTSVQDVDEWSPSHPNSITAEERNVGTHCIGGWVGSSVSLNAVQKRTLPYSDREVNSDSSVIRPVVCPCAEWTVSSRCDLQCCPIKLCS
jgi:hypothetical protein